VHKYFRRAHTNAHTYYNSYRDDSTANTNSNSDVYTNTNTNSDAHSDRDTYGYIYANADSYVHTDSNAYRYSLANVNSDCYSYIHANGNSDIHTDANSNSYFYTYADNYFHADSNAYRYSHTNVNSDYHSDIHADSNSDVHADSNANSYGYIYAYTDSYVYSHANGNRHSDSNSNGNGNGNGNTHPYANGHLYTDSNADSYSYADTAQRMCSISRVLEKSPSSVAGESVTAWEHHLQPATIVVDSGAANPWQWIGSTGSSGNCRKTQYCQWRERELYPANIGRGRYFDRGPGHSASGPWIPETEWRRAHAYPIQLRRVVRSSVHFASAADANFIPFSAGAADATTTAMRRRGIRLERSCC